MNSFRRYLSILLCMILLMTMPMSGVGAEEESEPTAPVETAVQVTPDPTDIPAETASPVETPIESPTEQPVEEPTNEASSEPSAEPSPERPDEPAGQPSQEPAETPSAEATVESTEEPLSEPFSEGFAVIKAGNPVYSDAALSNILGSFSADSVVYVTSRITADNESNDVLCFVFCFDGEIIFAYVRAAKLIEMSENEIDAYLSDCGAETAVYRGAKLAHAKFEYEQAEKTDAVEAAEIETAEPVTPESENDPVQPEASQSLTEGTVVSNKLTLASTTGSASVAGGDTLLLSASIETDDKMTQELIWSSSDEAVATVSASGVVTAKHVKDECFVTISARAAANSDISGSIVLRVYPVVRSIAILDSDNSIVSNGSTIVYEYDDHAVNTYSVSLQPAGIKCGVRCSSTDPTVAEVTANENGTFTVSAMEPGTAKISFTSDDGRAVCSFNIKVQISIASLRFQYAPGCSAVYVGKKKSVSLINNANAWHISVEPENATNRSFTYTSANKRVATVNAYGTVKGVAAGTTTVTAVAKDGSGKSVTVTVVVLAPVTKLSVKTASAYVLNGSSYTVKGAVTPVGSAAALELFSSDDSIVRPLTGRYNPATGGFDVEAVSCGTATLTIRAMDGSNKSASMKITVAERPERISVSVKGYTPETDSWNLAPKQKVNLIAEVFGENACSGIVWSSSNTSVATVSGGQVTAKKIYGKTVITAASAIDGSVKAAFTVNVGPAVTSMKLLSAADDTQISAYSFDLDDPACGELSLYAVAAPSNASQFVTWSSSNTSVVRVDNGVVTPVGCGTAKVTATAADGSRKAVSAAITVNRRTDSISSLSVPNEARYIGVGKTLTITAARVPEDSNSTIIWSCSPEGYLSVSGGVVKGIKASGDTPVTVTATLPDGSSAISCTLYVTSPVTGLTLSCAGDAIIDLNHETQEEIKANLSGTTLTADQVLLWSSSDPEIASVDENGIVTAHAPGSVKITAKATDGSGKTASATIKVIRGIDSFDGIPSDIYVAVKKSCRVYPVLYPAEATATLSYATSNAKIARVSNGVISGKKTGIAYITITPSAGSAAKAKTVTVHVMPAASTVNLRVNGTAVANKSVRYLYGPGKTMSMSAGISPATAYQTVMWTSSNPSVATVDENGLVTAVADGSAVIRATATDGTGKYSYVTVYVGDPVEKLYITGDHAVTVKKTISLKAHILPASAVNKAVTWTSSNAGIAKVSSSGVVTGVKSGTVTITATAYGTDGAPLVCRYIVNVVPKATGMSIYSCGDKVSGTTQYIDLEWNSPTLQLTALLTPDYSEQIVTWSSSNNSVATVNANGVVTGLKTGSATIKATAADGSKKYASVTVKVVDDGFSLKICGTTHSLIKGADAQLNVYPECTFSSSLLSHVTWISSDTAVATVSEDGHVTAVANGTATIVAVSDVMAGTFAAYDILVRDAVTSFEITGADTVIDMNSQAPHTLQLGYSTLPADGQMCSIRWESSDCNVATVDENGLVTAHGLGKAEIKATLLDGSGITATATVTADAYVQGVVLTNTGYDLLYNGESTTLTAALLPDGSDATLTWSCDSDLVTVNNGVVTVTGTPNGLVTVTVSATVNDGLAAVGTYTLKVSTVSGAGILYSADSSSVTITGYTGEGGSVRIPATINGLPVKTIATGAFTAANSAAITAIEFPDDVTFENDSVLGLAHLLSDGNNGFIIINGILCNYTGSATEVTIPAGVTEIGAGAFKGNTTITKITMPNAITVFHEEAFSGCTSLKTIVCR